MLLIAVGMALSRWVCLNVHLILLLVYSGVLIGLGLWIGRRVGTTDGFFVAGRRLGPGLLFATILAANIGAGSTVGAASLGYQNGLSAWWWVGSAGIGTLVLAGWVGPRIWRLARDHELLTVGDYLEWRYDGRVRLVATALLWVATLSILAAQLVAVAFVLEAVAGVPTILGCVIGGVVMTVYFSAGGLVTSAWVNGVQLVVLLVGFAIALPWAMEAAGGWSALVDAAPAARADYFAFVRGGASGWHYALLLVPAFVVSPGLLQKIYGARSARAVRVGVGASGIVLLLFAAVPPLLGMLARVYEPTLAGFDSNLALPIVLTAGLPVLLGSLGLAAVFSAELSSADAILFMLSTSLSEDLYRRFVKRDASDPQVLTVARLGAVLGGVLGTVLAIVLGSVIESMTIFYSLLGVILFVPVLGGLYVRRAGSREALAAIAAGVVGYLGARMLIDFPTGSLWNANAVGLIASALAFVGSMARRG